MSRRVVARASPSLALIKYWGKKEIDRNTPATSSVAVTLDELYTTSSITTSGGDDSVVVDGVRADPSRFTRFFRAARECFATDRRFCVTSTNNFPTASGLASSSSGFAALALGCARFCEAESSTASLSALARVGSASAARSLYGGFTTLRSGALEAEPLLAADHWPELRVVVVAVTSEQKSISTRDAMNRAMSTSPFYKRWVESSGDTFEYALAALTKRDLATLGGLMRTSYLSMFSTMFTSSPPVIYWTPDTVSLIRLCEELRSAGKDAWETMDAGPQVKIATTKRSVSDVVAAVEGAHEGWKVTVTKPGQGASIIEESET